MERRIEQVEPAAQLAQLVGGETVPPGLGGLGLQGGLELPVPLQSGKVEELAEALHRCRTQVVVRDEPTLDAQQLALGERVSRLPERDCLQRAESRPHARADLVLAKRAALPAGRAEQLG